MSAVVVGLADVGKGEGVGGTGVGAALQETNDIEGSKIPKRKNNLASLNRWSIARFSL